jgi:hypothetical protein
VLVYTRCFSCSPLAAMKTRPSAADRNADAAQPVLTLALRCCSRLPAAAAEKDADAAAAAGARVRPLVLVLTAGRDDNCLRAPPTKTLTLPRWC